MSSQRTESEKNKNHEMNVQTGSSLFEVDIKKDRNTEKFDPQEYLFLDSFNEDEAEQKFLNSKPTCFLLIGKPGVGKSTLAKKLSQEWKAELINPTELIKQNIKQQTELGKKAQDILMKGEAVSETMVASMINAKLNSPEVVHHGYVLEGFPCQSENGFDISQQMDMLKNWKLQPDFIINLRISDKDLTTRRVYQKVDPVSGIVYIKEMYAPEKPKPKQKSNKTEGEEEKPEEEGGEEEEEQVEEKPQEPKDEFFTAVPNDIVDRLVVRPEDTLPFVNESIKNFKDTLLHVLEDQMANMDQSYLLELDANLSPTVLIKQLAMRLQSYIITKAAKPLRLNDPVETTEGEEAGDNAYVDSGEIEETLNGLQIKRRVASNFKWRRSKCSFYCPVSLKNGKTVTGKAQFSAAFLDKVYLMADENALQEFLKNPRPFLKLPQPRAPCKLSILGCNYTGKTTLSALLAKKYNAKVIDMETLMQPEMKRTKEEMIDKAKQEAIQIAIENIKTKYKEKLEDERVRREQELAAAAEAQEAQEALEAQEKQENKELQGVPESQEGASIEPELSGDAESKQELEQKTEQENRIKKESIPREEPEIDKMVHLNEEGEIIVDMEHNEIKLAANKAVEEASKMSVSLPASDYVKVLQSELDKIRKERIKLESSTPTDGSWILDNFPNTADQLNAMVENNLIPDTFIVLQDSSEDQNILLKRWYSLNRETIDKQIETRIAREEAQKIEEKRKAEEALRPAPLEMELEVKPIAPITAEETIEGENQNRIESLEKIVEEDEAKEIANKTVNGSKPASPVVVPLAGSKDEKTIESSVQARTPIPSILPPKTIETLEFLNQLKTTMEQVRNVQSTIVTLTGNEATVIEIKKSSDPNNEVKSKEEICSEAFKSIEKIFNFVAAEFEGGEEETPAGDEEEEGGEEEEEEEGANAEDGEEAEEEEDEDSFDPTFKDKKIKFGETNHYCAVSLHNKGILVPGNLEQQLKYRDKIYRFSNEENKMAFMENPDLYLPSHRKRMNIPPPRILILGPRGSGKSTQARILAKNLDIFHVKFRDYLQELIIGKVKKIVEPEREEDKENEEEQEEDDEEDPNNKKPKEKPIQPELNEKEETIKGYLEKDEALPNEIVDEVLNQLWNAEPFKSRGFVLDGFPNNENESSYLLEKSFLPDVILIMKIDEENILKRLLPPRLERWMNKMKAKQDKKRAKIQKKKEKLMKKMQERRNEEIAKFEEARKQREIEAAENGEEAEEEEFNVDAIIQEEFADELGEEEQIEEIPVDEVKENMTNDIKTTFDNQTNQIETIKEALQEALIPRYKIDGNRRPNIVSFIIKKKLEKITTHRQSLFERVYPIKLKLANKLLDFGYKQLSRFGRWCPVKLLDNAPVQPYYDEKKKPFTVIHRSYIYFLSSKEAKKKFMEDPIHYLKQPSPLSVVPFRLSVVGPPKSGKTTLANRFAKEFGCVRLSIGEAIRAILLNQSHTELAQEIRSHLVKGKTVPDELAIECLEVSILDVKCQLKGYILDGYPITKQQIKLMTDHSLIPVKVIELKCEIKEIMQRCIKDRTSSERLSKNLILNDSPEIIGYKMREWKNEIVYLRDWYNTEHKNYVQLDGSQSKWLLWEEAKKIGFESIKLIQVYLNRISNQKAASIAKLCVTYDEMLTRLGDFGQYCPVSLAIKEELIDCSENRSMDFVAEFQGYYYKMFSEKELNLFLENPQNFVAPNAPRKLPPPNQLPKKRTPSEVKALFPKPIELNGYCSVTYFKGKERYEAIEQGFIEHAAEYKNKIYYMTNLEALNQFMKKPELYANLKLPHKLPPVKSQISVVNLPMTGYLEQTVSDLLKRSLNEVGNYKPKFPFLSPTRSALLYVAYYLKAYNPKSTEYRRKKYKQKLAYFEEKCELIDFLYNSTTLKYKEPSKRSIEYNTKFESFFALQENAPTMNWLA